MSVEELMCRMTPSVPRDRSSRLILGKHINEDDDYPFEVSDENENRVYYLVRGRCGGGNREEYGDEIDKISEHHLYIDDRDDGWDRTYAWFLFKVPDNLQEQALNEVSQEDLIDGYQVMKHAFS